MAMKNFFAAILLLLGCSSMVQGQQICPLPLLDGSAESTIPIPVPGTPIICTFQCEGTMVSRSEIDVYNVMEKAISGVSMVCAVFLVATWGLFAAKAKQKMTFWISVCSLMVTSGIFVGALAKGTPRNVWCRTDSEGYKQTDGLTWCVLQGLFIIFFGLSLCCWWWCSCFDIFSKLYRRKRNIQHYLKWYHWFSWGLPAINTMVLLVSQDFGFNQPRLWCFLSPDAPGSYEFIFFYAWVGILWVTGTLLMFMVIWSVLAHTRSYRRGESSGSYFKKLALYKTPIMFVFVFSLFWAIFFSFIFITKLQEDSYRVSAESWAKCLIAGKLQAGVPFPHNTTNPGQAALIPPAPANQIGCGEVQPNRIPPGLLTTAVITISGNSIMLFLIFGFLPENYKLWYNWLRTSCCAMCTKDDPRATISSPTPSKSSLTDGVVLRATAALSTFGEIRSAIANGIITVFYFITCQEREQEPPPNRSPRLRFDQPGFNPNAYNTGASGYTPRYYLNKQGSSSKNLAVANPAGQQGDDLDELPGYYGHGGNAPAKEQVYAAGRHESSWSDAYDDPLWGINVEF